MTSFRDAVAVLLLAVLAGAGMIAATGFLVLASVFGSGDGWGDLIRSIALTAAGFAGVAVVPAVVALWLRTTHPVASGALATGIGVVALALSGPRAAESGTAMLIALGGLLLVVCAVPLPPAEAGDTFAG